MTLVKNENYWEPGLPKVDSVVIPIVTDSNSRILQLKGGQVDGIIGQNDIALSTVADLDSDANLKVYKFTSTYNNFVVFNTRNAPLSDMKVRQALNYATDKQSIIKSILYGNADFSNSFMPRGALFWNPDQPGYPFDITKAQSLMAASTVPGWLYARVPGAFWEPAAASDRDSDEGHVGADQGKPRHPAARAGYHD